MTTFLRFVWTELNPYKKTIAICSLLAIAAAGLDTLAPVVLGQGFDRAGAGRAWIFYGGAFLAWFLLRACADRIRSFISNRGNYVADVTLIKFRARTMLDLLDRPLGFHYGAKGLETTEVVNRLANHLSGFIEGTIFDLVPALLATLAILGYLAVLAWPVALLLALTLGAYVVHAVHAAPIQQAIQKKWNRSDNALWQTGWDAVRNVLVVKSTANEAMVGRMLDQQIASHMPLEQELLATTRRITNTQNLIVAMGSALAFAVGAAYFRSGAWTFGKLTAVTAYVFTIFGYVRYVMWQFRTGLRAASNHKALTEILAVPKEDFVSGADVTLKGDIEFKNVRFRYREDKPALEDVSFKIGSGMRVAIVGESGEGKTTLVDLLGRYYLPQSGLIFFDDVDGKTINLRSLRGQMGYVPQDLTLFHDTIGANIRFGKPGANDKEVAEAVRRAHLETFIEGLPEKYDTMVGERGLKLSGGERQRVALARAFLRDPKILVLDEPTSQLDSKTEEGIRQSLGELMKERTTFIIAHRLKTVMDADLILVLKDGRIVESGTHDMLIKNAGGAYAALLRAQGGFISPDEKHLG